MERMFRGSFEVCKPGASSMWCVMALADHGAWTEGGASLGGAVGLRKARHQVRAAIGPGARLPTSSDRFLAGNPDDARMTVVGIDTVAIVGAERRKAIAWYRDV